MRGEARCGASQKAIEVALRSLGASVGDFGFFGAAYAAFAGAHFLKSSGFANVRLGSFSTDLAGYLTG